MTQSATLRPSKTWSHLAAQRRRPSEYEIVSTNLLWHTRDAKQPWDIEGFMTGWYQKNLFGCALKHPDWNKFRDPDEQVYRTYNINQDGQESYVDGLLEQFAAEEHDKGLSATWAETLSRLYTPIRYPLHLVQMASGYLASISPASTIACCAMFQSGDALRWLSRTAYRTRELANAHPQADFAKEERERWENAPEWQGFRELGERVLAAYEWGESFYALNIILKPALDEAVNRQLATAARRNGDSLFALLAEAQLRDSARSQRWTTSLVKLALEGEGNAEVFENWAKKWVPLAEKAVRTYCAAIPDHPEAGDMAVNGMQMTRSAMGLKS
ncbi:MAG: toluene monooxygenase [Acidovorax sp.]|nr:toluene monooxygenase [Acidovorax sp.]